MTETPIHDQLRVEFAVRRLAKGLAAFTVAGTVAGQAIRRAQESQQDGIRRAQVRLAPPAPADVLDRIRRDQLTLDWQESWRAEREAARLVDAYTEGWPRARR